jgi:hypothetical protein
MLTAELGSIKPLSTERKNKRKGYSFAGAAVDIKDHAGNQALSSAT